MQIKEFSTEIGEKPLVAKFTDLADQTNGSVILTYGDTVVLATAVMSGHAKEGMNYFPLTVDYEEKFYAAGQILGSRFMRRESRPSEDATLTGRVIDRTLRPLFEQHIRNEIQVIVTVLSIGEDDPDVLAINAASLAISNERVAEISINESGTEGFALIEWETNFLSTSQVIYGLASGGPYSINISMPNFGYLKKKLDVTNQSQLKEFLLKKTEDMDFKSLARDVEPFLFDPRDNNKVFLFREFIQQNF